MKNGQPKAFQAQEQQAQNSDRQVVALLDPAAQAAIKPYIRTIWDRVRVNGGLNQEGLAKALRVNQPAVSRLLKNDTGHPWTAIHLAAFAGYVNCSVLELIPEKLRGALQGYLIPSDANARDDGFLRECVLLVKRICAENGLTRVSEEAAQRLGGTLAGRAINFGVKRAEMERELARLTLEEAIGRRADE